MAAIAAALAATERAGTARVLLSRRLEDERGRRRLEETIQELRGPARDRARGRLRRVRESLIGAGAFVAESLLESTAEGLVDFDRRLAALDWGDYAILVEGDQEWSGRSGKARSRRPQAPAGDHQPFWLLDLLREVVAVDWEGVEVVRGLACRHLLARASLERAPERARSRMEGSRPGSTSADIVEVACAIDDEGRLRRIRAYPGAWSFALELFDFGVPVEREWPALPRFRD